MSSNHASSAYSGKPSRFVNHSSYDNPKQFAIFNQPGLKRGSKVSPELIKVDTEFYIVNYVD